MTVSVLEVDCHGSGGQGGRLVGRALDVIGMDKLHKRARGQLVDAVSEGDRPRVVEPFEIAVKAGDREQVKRQCEQSVGLGRLLALGIKNCVILRPVAKNAKQEAEDAEHNDAQGRRDRQDGVPERRCRRHWRSEVYPSVCAITGGWSMGP